LLIVALTRRRSAASSRNMPKAAPNWPSVNTRALIAGKYDRLFQQTSKLFGEELAYRMILRAVLGNVDATD